MKKGNSIFFLFILLTVFSWITAGQTQVLPQLGVTKFNAADDTLLTVVEHQTFQYFWEGAEPISGMARERINMNGIYPEKDQNIVTTGGSGFGTMVILTGIERKFITRQQGRERLQQIVDFLKKADRFHGVWPHWLNGETGKTKPFSPNDDGADLVETAYLMQGLLAVREYFSSGTPAEQKLSSDINQLWKTVEWNWFTRNGENVLYWHWSPTHNWEMNFGIQGYNECLITYILAASSPTYSIPASVYHQGWARLGAIKTNVTTYGYTLTLKHNGADKYGGPLFWAHYSFLGLNPDGLKDGYANYWEQNKNLTLINRQWCIENSKHYKGYDAHCWGLSASYSMGGYAAHAPGEKNDLGVITPAAALSSFPYTPEYSMEALRYFYAMPHGKLWGKFGFYDAFSEEFNWYPKQYLAIDQGPEVVMIENYRTGLLWKLFMASPEIQVGLKKLGFEYKCSK